MQTFNNTPPRIIKRNSLGLLEDVNYVFREDGYIDWRKMVKPEYLVPNSQRTNETDVTKLDDKDLLILLQGLKELSLIRGFDYVKYHVVTASVGYVMMTCEIQWIPNYETEGRSVVFSGTADASLENTESFAQYYLAAIAENRAFARCVRNFLLINIVAKEEIGKVKPIRDVASDAQIDLLTSIMTKKKVSWEHLKEKMIKEAVAGAADFQSLRDVPKEKIFEYIERLKKYNP